MALLKTMQMALSVALSDLQVNAAAGKPIPDEQKVIVLTSDHLQDSVTRGLGTGS